MKKVIDAGALRSDELFNFLSGSTQNIAVITDYAQIESFKGNGMINGQNSLRILAQFQQQIMVLRPSYEIAELKPRSKGLHQRLVDQKHSAEFGLYCKIMVDELIPREVLEYQAQRKQHLAENRLGQIEDQAEEIRLGMTKLFSHYPPDQLKRIRSGELISDAFADHILADILACTAIYFRKTVGDRPLPSPSGIFFSIQFRFALCSYVLALKWAGDCGHETVSTARLRNDFIDATYAAYATFFDGLITKDNKLSEVYSFSRWLLNNAFEIS
ncbi:MAG: hypothetical protein JWM68_2297 [Verrucomicrobiales bacterium]|nr:hypothetical protein [Verrucomicrobiales bacterium]